MGLGLLHTACAIGMAIEPVLEGDTANYPSLSNLKHCLAYHTNNDEVMLIKVDSGAKQKSQYLNLKIFDSEDNLLRVSNDISNEVSIILKNLNNDPIEQNDNNSNNHDNKNQNRARNGIRANIIDKLSPFGVGGGSGKDPKKLEELLNNDKGKNLIYVCFVNIYNDRSWSFEPKPREVEVSVNLRDVSSMHETNYNLYSKYFNKFQANDNTNKYLKNMNEEEFEHEINVLENELNNVVENLQNSALILTNILEQESKLRDVNEAIFSRYTLLTAIILIIIFVVGIFQILFLKKFSKKYT